MMKRHEIILALVGAAVSIYFAVAIDDMVSTAGRQPPFPGKPAAEKWILYDKQGNEIGFAEKR